MRPAALTTRGRLISWTTKGAVPLPGRPFPFHPNPAGMRAVAELVAAQVSKAQTIVRPIIELKG